MNSRLTLGDWRSLATELRRLILEKENPARLASLQEDEAQTTVSARPSYAFEFFLDRYRERFRRFFEESVDYCSGYSSASIEKDEQRHSLERLARMTTELFIDGLVEKGRIDEITSNLLRVESPIAAVEYSELKRFFFEILYELAREFSRERVHGGLD